ncbi:hypothetical protein Dimus_038530 [Dionaea muscipula]
MSSPATDLDLEWRRGYGGGSGGVTRRIWAVKEWYNSFHSCRRLSNLGEEWTMATWRIGEEWTMATWRRRRLCWAASSVASDDDVLLVVDEGRHLFSSVAEWPDGPVKAGRRSCGFAE